MAVNSIRSSGGCTVLCVCWPICVAAAVLQHTSKSQRSQDAGTEAKLSWSSGEQRPWHDAHLVRALQVCIVQFLLMFWQRQASVLPCGMMVPLVVFLLCSWYRT
jgi:hypothetical protein